MGVYLLLELQVPVLRLVGLFPFLEHGLPGRDGEVYYVDYAVDTQLRQDADRKEQDEFIPGKCVVEPERQPVSCQERRHDGHGQDKSREQDGFPVYAFLWPVPAHESYVDDIQADCKKDGERIAQKHPDDAV